MASRLVGDADTIKFLPFSWGCLSLAWRNTGSEGCILLR